MPYASWQDVPRGALRDNLQLIATVGRFHLASKVEPNPSPLRVCSQDNPTTICLDSLIRTEDDLAILVKTLKGAPVHTVTTLSLRYCALKTDEATALLSELISEAWENEKPKGVIMHGPNLAIIETLYLR